MGLFIMKNTISLTSLVVLLISLHGCSTTTRNDYYEYKNTTIVRKSKGLTSEKKTDNNLHNCYYSTSCKG